MATSDKQLSLIFKYVAKASSTRTLDDLLLVLTDMGRDLIESERCTIWLRDELGKQLWTKVAHGIDRISIPENTGLVGAAIYDEMPIIVNDPYSDPRFNRDVDLKTNFVTTSIAVIPLFSNEKHVIGAFQAINKLGTQQFVESDIDLLKLVASYCGNALESAVLKEELEHTQLEIIHLLGNVGEANSEDTGKHVQRVAEYCQILARQLQLSEEEIALIREASPLHDIGKVAIPDSIISKPGKLTDEEFDIIKTHTLHGETLLSSSPRKLMKAAAIIAGQHHEKYNGRGYHRGLVGEEIHIFGRIAAVADVFDALGTERSYKKPWELDRICELFRQERGEHFCPKVIDAFFEALPAILEVRG